MNARCPCRLYHQDPTSHEVGMECRECPNSSQPLSGWYTHLVRGVACTRGSAISTSILCIRRCGKVHRLALLTLCKSFRATVDCGLALRSSANSRLASSRNPASA